MTRRQFKIGKFGRTVSYLNGGGNLGNPSDSLNFMLDGFHYKPRWGYVQVGAAPDPDFEGLGLGYAVNSSGVNEFLSVEDWGGTVQAYSIDPDTFVRTEITSDPLNDGRWLLTSFYNNAYFINPSGTKTVYRHVIGDDTSFVALQDQDYDPPADVELNIAIVEPSSIYDWVATDTVTYPTDAGTYPAAGITKVYNANGSIELSGASSDTGGAAGGFLQIQTVFPANQDFSGHDYLTITFQGETYLKYFLAHTTLPQIRIGGVWTNVTDAKWYINPDDPKQAVWFLYLSGMTVTASEGIRFNMQCKPGRGATTAALTKFVTISPVMGGGYYLEASAAGDRIWDSALDGDGITYGFRYSDGATTHSTIKSKFISAASAQGFFADSWNFPSGGILVLSVAAPVAPYDRVQFLRLDASVSPAEWKLVNTDTTVPMVYQDAYKEYQVPGLTTITTGTAPDPTPVFRTSGIRYAFPFKQFMVWLIGVGESNIQMSRVGDPEELYDSDQTYDADDLTQPAQLTMADNQSDRPIWGVQAGANAFIVGEQSAYALVGDYPIQMSPSRQIPGSRGIAGPLAGARFRPLNGIDGAAYADPDLNVWLVNSTPEFVGDTRATPTELSMPVRGKLKEFLYTEQLPEFPTLSLADVKLVYQEQTSSLWVILGRRAGVLRQDMIDIGWELYKYSLTTDGVEVEACTTYAPGTVATSVATGDVAWTNVGYPFASDDAYCTALLPFGTAQTTEKLRITGFTPAPTIPVSATIDTMSISVERSVSSDDLIVTETTAQPLDGTSNLGTNRSTSYGLTETDTIEVFVSSANLTTAEINAGDFGFDLKYTQETWDATNWNNPANWTITVSGSGTSASMTVTATYIGPGSPPSKIWVNITSAVTASVFSSGYAVPYTIAGNATIDNGQGESGTSGVSRSEDLLGNLSIGNYTETSTVKTKITLTAGTGTSVLTRSGSGTITSNVGGSISPTVAIAYTGSAAFVAPDQSTVRVDNVMFRVCYTIPAVPGFSDGVAYALAFFTADSRLLAMRSTGELDLIEYDFRFDETIGGSNRDGGYPMPTGFLTTQDMAFEGLNARMNGVQVNTRASDDVFLTYSKVQEGSFVIGTDTGSSASRWSRFPLSQIGLSHQVKVTADEDLTGIEGLAIEYQPTSKEKAK